LKYGKRLLALRSSRASTVVDFNLMQPLAIQRVFKLILRA
jgi:hypothetical protein